MGERPGYRPPEVASKPGRQEAAEEQLSREANPENELHDNKERRETLMPGSAATQTPFSAPGGSPDPSAPGQAADPTQGQAVVGGPTDAPAAAAEQQQDAQEGLAQGQAEAALPLAETGLFAGLPTGVTDEQVQQLAQQDEAFKARRLAELRAELAVEQGLAEAGGHSQQTAATSTPASQQGLATQAERASETTPEQGEEYDPYLGMGQ